MKLIINADDYGMDCNVNAAVIDCFKRGWITQTTLMVNMPDCEAAIALAKENDVFDRIGLHLNLSSGEPLTEGIKKSPYFCDDAGRFNNAVRKRMKSRFYLPSYERKAVEDEINAQMDKFIALGLPMRHYDSHGHVGAYLSVLQTALTCAKQHGFRSTRNWINMSGSHRDIPMSFSKRVYVKLVEHIVENAGLIHPDYLGWAWDIKRLPKNINERTVVEILCHPMYAADDPNMAKLERVNKIISGGVLIDTFHHAESTLGKLAEISANRITYQSL